MLDFDGINSLIGTEELLALGRRYEVPVQPTDNRSSVRR